LEATDASTSVTKEVPIFARRDIIHNPHLEYQILPSQESLNLFGTAK
jgi:hypothetical protein